MLGDIQGRRNLTPALRDPNLLTPTTTERRLRTDRKPSGAIADYNQAIERNPLLAEAYGNRGFVHYRLGDKAEAIADLQKSRTALFKPRRYSWLPSNADVHSHGSAAANGQPSATMTLPLAPRQTKTSASAVWSSNHRLSPAMMPATVQAKSNHKGLTNSPISRRLLVNSTSGNTANGNCKLKTTWLKTSKFPASRQR